MKMMRMLSLAVCLVLCVQVAGAALTDGLVCYYQADGDMTDSSGNGHNGTEQSGTANYTTGKVGQAFAFAKDWNVNCGAFDIDPTDTDEFSLSFWVQKTNAGDYAGILSKKDGAGESFFFDLKSDADQKADFKATNYFNGIGDGSATVNAWHHLVILVWSDGSAEYFIDGVSKNTKTSGIAVADLPGVGLYLGTKGDNGNKWNGYLDEVAIWNRVITTDEIAMLYNNGNGAPISKAALNIAPTIGEENVAYTPSLDLEWGAGGAAEIGESYTLYFDDTNDISSPLYSETVIYDGNDMAVTITDYATLADGTMYYWKVDDPNGPGAIWNFTTKTSLYITDQPASVLDALEGDDVDFSVTVVADNGVASVDWRVMVDDVNSVSVWTDNSGALTSTLSLVDVDSGSEGDYFAVITDGVSAQVTSDVVTLDVLNDLIAHWRLDNDLTEDVAGNNASFIVDGYNGNDSAAVYDPNGAIDQGIILDGVGNYMRVYSNVQPDDSGLFTIGMWIKWNGDNIEAQTWQGLADFHYYDGDGQAFGFIVDENTDKLGIKSGTNSTPLLASTTLPTGEWVQAVMTYDGTNAEIWQNGSKVLDEAFSYSKRTSNARTTLGAATDRDLYNFNGNMDDIKFFNYPQSADEIILEYFDVTGNYGCSGNPEFDSSGPEGTPDCKVDLYDFVDFAGDWLDCNRIPAEACN